MAERHGCLISSDCPFYIAFWVGPLHTRRNYPLILWAWNYLFFFFRHSFIFIPSFSFFYPLCCLALKFFIWVGSLGAGRLYGGNIWEVGGKGVCGRESAVEESVGGTIGKWELLWWGSGRGGVCGGGGQGCMGISGRWWSLYGWEVCLWQRRICENLWIH